MSVLLYCFAFSDILGDISRSFVSWLVLEFVSGVEVLLVPVIVCPSWIDSFPSPAIVVARGAAKLAINRMSSRALSLFRLIFCVKSSYCYFSRRGF